MWDAGIPEGDMLQAAKDALIHDFIMSRPGGYDSKVAEGGRNMSGGQKQRLEIARALVTNPRILVLDEATSALDTGTEEQIEHNLRRRGCSCVVVAHRLSTIRDCNLIIVLSQGVIVEQGSHDELLALPEGYYRSLLMHD
jgi:ABC-type bacteriocin/lantibiotic exporter with double-glycine peptidase domain